jgi:hypothetical protein
LDFPSGFLAGRNEFRRQATLFSVLALIVFPGLMSVGDHGECLQFEV